MMHSTSVLVCLLACSALTDARTQGACHKQSHAVDAYEGQSNVASQGYGAVAMSKSYDGARASKGCDDDRQYSYDGRESWVSSSSFVPSPSKSSAAFGFASYGYGLTESRDAKYGWKPSQSAPAESKTTSSVSAVRPCMRSTV